MLHLEPVRAMLISIIRKESCKRFRGGSGEVEEVNLAIPWKPGIDKFLQKMAFKNEDIGLSSPYSNIYVFSSLKYCSIRFHLFANTLDRFPES